MLWSLLRKIYGLGEQKFKKDGIRKMNSQTEPKEIGGFVFGIRLFQYPSGKIDYRMDSLFQIS